MLRITEIWGRQDDHSTGRRSDVSPVKFLPAEQRTMRQIKRAHKILEPQPDSCHTEDNYASMYSVHTELRTYKIYGVLHSLSTWDSLRCLILRGRPKKPVESGKSDASVSPTTRAWKSALRLPNSVCRTVQSGRSCGTTYEAPWTTLLVLKSAHIYTYKHTIDPVGCTEYLGFCCPDREPSQPDSGCRRLPFQRTLMEVAPRAAQSAAQGPTRCWGVYR